jgi:hypothetical protein
VGLVKGVDVGPSRPDRSSSVTEIKTTSSSQRVVAAPTEQPAVVDKQLVVATTSASNVIKEEMPATSVVVRSTNTRGFTVRSLFGLDLENIKSLYCYPRNLMLQGNPGKARGRQFQYTGSFGSEYLRSHQYCCH